MIYFSSYKKYCPLHVVGGKTNTIHGQIIDTLLPALYYPLIHPVLSTAISITDSNSRMLITDCETGTLNMIKASATTAMINMMMAMIMR